MMSDAERASQANRRPINREPVDLPPVLRPRTMPLANRRVTMEPIDPKAHAAGLFEAMHEPGGDEIWNYLPYGPYPDEAAVTAWLRGCAAGADPVFYAIRDNVTGALGGMASLMEIRPLMGVIEVGHIWFSPHLQRTVQASEAIFTLMRHAFDDLGICALCGVSGHGNRALGHRVNLTIRAGQGGHDQGAAALGELLEVGGRDRVVFGRVAAD